jgi:hypothetical protein
MVSMAFRFLVQWLEFEVRLEASVVVHHAHLVGGFFAWCGCGIYTRRGSYKYAKIDFYIKSLIVVWFV